VFVTALFFIGIGIGLRGTSFWNVDLELWTIVMGFCASAGVIAAEILAEKIDQAQKHTGEKAYAGFSGFDFDDILFQYSLIAFCIFQHFQ